MSQRDWYMVQSKNRIDPAINNLCQFQFKHIYDKNLDTTHCWTIRHTSRYIAQDHKLLWHGINDPLFYLEFEDTKGVIRSHKSKKYRQYNAMAKIKDAMGVKHLWKNKKVKRQSGNTEPPRKVLCNSAS